MEYAAEICESIRDDNYIRNVGYKEDNKCITKYFSTSTLRIISAKITELLQGVDPENRAIIVPDKTVAAAERKIDGIINLFNCCSE